MNYYGDLLDEHEKQTRYPYLYTEAEVKSLRDRLANALEKLWMGTL
jgi:hypothetical protein